ncbi:hypothetical protein EJ04DRAFT_563219 [Polyplosphaeria fusca]|uniref:Fungal N-terminal domain-containing protein n=1 Tax=Polyplosphaeria fusca TaxID=682080 RepID=A0A9P4QX32_9PLEO|nr:hypothetical protein EJ04DRAFT_563219 [Polyplosphaeria fusca]
MVEALAAVSLAGNILQFVEVGAKVLAKSKQIYLSADGMADDIFNISTVINELDGASDKLKQDIGPSEAATVPTAMDASLDTLRKRCCSVNEELRGVLRDLSVDGKNTKWKSLKKALAHEWKSGRLQAIQASLFTVRDQMQFQITVSLRENLDLVAVQQTEAFRGLDATAQTIITATHENRQDILEAICKHTNNLQSSQLDALDDAVTLVRGDIDDLAADIQRHLDASQQAVDMATEIILEQEVTGHNETLERVDSHVNALGEQITEEHMGTRAVVVQASKQIRSVMDRAVDQLHTIHARFAQAHLVQQERSREELREWVVEFMTQQAKLSEANVAAIQAKLDLSARPPSKKARKALKITLQTAQEALRRTYEVLKELVQMFEKDFGLRYKMVQDLILHCMGPVDPASFVKQLLGYTQEEKAVEVSEPNSVQPFTECPPANNMPSIVLTDAADPEIQAAFLDYFDYQLGRAPKTRSVDWDHAITSGAWDMAFMSISWSVSSTGPFWGLNRGFLQGLALSEWDKFKDQKWIFVHHDRQLHVLEVSNANDDSFLRQVPLHVDSVLKLAQFQWELIAGEDRLVAFEVWPSPLTTSAPKTDYFKSVQRPYSVSNTNFSASVLRKGVRAADLRGSGSDILQNTPAVTTKYGQPLRHPRPQTVWGLFVSKEGSEELHRDDSVGGSRISVHWEIEAPRGSAVMEPVEF